MTDIDETIRRVRELDASANRGVEHDPEELADYYRTAAPLLADECERLRARVEVLEKALATVRDELGVPGPDYPAPVANAANAARAALKGGE